MSEHDPFTWHGIEFYWSQNRSAWIGSLLVGTFPSIEHQLFLQSGDFSSVGLVGHRAWWEWGGRHYTLPVTHDERDAALALARDELFGLYMVMARQLGAL